MDASPVIGLDSETLGGNVIFENALVTVIRSKSTVTDEYNNTEPDWSDVDESEGLPAQVQPMNSEEAIRDRDTLTVHVHLWVDWHTQTLLYTDRVGWNGDTYEVDGAVEELRLGDVLEHYHAVLKLVT